MNKQLEQILRIIIKTSDENNTTNIDCLSQTINEPKGKIMLDIYTLQEQKLVRVVADGYLIQVTPLGMQHFEANRKVSSSNICSEPRICLILPTITFIVGTLLGFIICSFIFFHMH